MVRTRRIAMLMAAAAVAARCGGGGSGGYGAPTSPSNPGGGSGGTTNGATVTINITGQGGKLAFNPNPATVNPGQLVVFKNNDIVPHHVIMDDGSVQTADIPPGGTSAAVPMGTGDSKSYHCSIHPGMVGGFNGQEVEPPPNCNQAYCYGGGD